MISSLYQRYIWPALLFVWLRFRIDVNIASHASKLSKILTIIGTVSVYIATVCMWFLGFCVGVFLPKSLGVANYFLLWDGVAIMTVVAWLIHVLNETQRGDPISFDKILHLPVSPGQAFIVNYLSSLGAVVFLMSAGGSLGLILGSLFSVGWVALLMIFPVGAFLFALTSVTFWLQGWIAKMMTNIRTKQFALVLIPVVIIAVTQVPVQFFLWMTRYERNVAEPQKRLEPFTVAEPDVDLQSNHQSNSEQSVESDPSHALPEEMMEPSPTEAAVGGDRVDSSQVREADNLDASNQQDNSQAIGQFQVDKGARKNQRIIKENKERRALRYEYWRLFGKACNIALPPLWVAAAIDGLVTHSGASLIPWFFTFVMTLVGVKVLRWSYRDTLKYWRGEFTTSSFQTKPRERQSTVQASADVTRANQGRTAEKLATGGAETFTKLRLYERSLPWVTDDVSAVFTMTLISMRRAPEMKMYFLFPLLALAILFGLTQRHLLPPNDYLRCLIICGLAGFFFFTSQGVLGNMFAYDRSGFRAFVLSGMKRSQILIGRNLAQGSMIGVFVLLVCLGGSLYIGQPTKLVISSVLISLSVLPMFLLLTNLMAIYTPFPIASGSIQPKHFDFMTVVVNLLLSMILPLIWLVALFPLLVEFLFANYVPRVGWFPWSIPLSLLINIASFFLYWRLVEWEGWLLQGREKELLRVVTSKPE